jgi:hypothetical protein
VGVYHKDPFEFVAAVASYREDSLQRGVAILSAGYMGFLLKPFAPPSP